MWRGFECVGDDKHNTDVQLKDHDKRKEDHRNIIQRLIVV